MDTDGQPVTTEVSEGTPEPAVVETAAPDPTEAKIAAALEAFAQKQERELSRKIQSEADKRTAPLQKRLAEAESRARSLEGMIGTFPQIPDADPTVVNQLQNAQLQRQVGYYRQQQEVAARQEALENYKRQALEGLKSHIQSLGLDPEDTRIEYDLSQPDRDDFYRKAMASVAKVIREDSDKELPNKLQKMLADAEAKARRETGVDTHETAGKGILDNDDAFAAAAAREPEKFRKPADMKRLKAINDRILRGG